VGDSETLDSTTEKDTERTIERDGNNREKQAAESKTTSMESTSY
jgi:hypothetical protein